MSFKIVMTVLSDVKLVLELAQHPVENRNKGRGILVALCPTCERIK